MNTNITINGINKVRSLALRWAKRTENCKWTSLPYLCMRIGRCMRKLGLQYTVIELTDCEGREVVYLSLDYTEDEHPFKSVVDECETLYRNEKANVSYALPLALMIVKCCQQLTDYIYEQE